LPINSLTYEQLQRYDVGRLRPGSDYAKRFPRQQPVDGTRIPRLAELFALVKANKTIRFNIEPKSDLDAPQETLAPEPFARALIAEVREAGVEKRTTVQAFDWRLLKVVERDAPEMPTVYCTEGKGSDPARVHAAGGKIWSPDFEMVTPERLAAARKWGMKVTVWTVNEPADIARMIDLGVDGMASDYPDRVLAQLKAKR
jgi:glycerophosphoryl diester phosphodiesterase